MIFLSFLKNFPRILFCMFRSEDKQYLHDFYKPFTCKELCGGLNVGKQIKLFQNSVLALLHLPCSAFLVQSNMYSTSAYSLFILFGDKPNTSNPGCLQNSLIIQFQLNS